MPYLRSIFAASLIVEAALAVAQEPICNPCVDGPEMFQRKQLPGYPPVQPRKLAERESRIPGVKTVTESDLLTYASAPYDKSALSGKTFLWGYLNDVGILVEHLCADVCPEYTVRVIQLMMPAGASCDSVGGVEKSLRVPIGIATTQKSFCFPRILVDHWDAYIK